MTEGYGEIQETSESIMEDGESNYTEVIQERRGVKKNTRKIIDENLSPFQRAILEDTVETTETDESSETPFFKKIREDNKKKKNK